MPWESRIKSEPRRRFVVAALMLGLLFGSTAVAVLFSHARRVDPVLSLYDAFTLRMPDGYHRVPPTASPSPWLNVLRDSSNLRSPIHVRYYPNQRFVQPLEVYQAARQERGWMSGSAEGKSYHHGALQVLLFASQSDHAVEGRTQTVSEVMAVATVDGRSYLAVYTKAFGPLHPEDTARIRKMALSINDTHYTPIPNRNVDLGGARITVPEPLAAYTLVTPKANTPPSVSFAPTTGEQFYRLLVYALPAEYLRTTADLSMDQAIERFLAGHLPKTDPTQAPAGTVETVKIDGRTVQIAQVAVGQTIGTRYHEWAVALGESHVLCIRIIADKNSQAVAEDAARRIVASAHVAPTNQSPPTPQGSKE